MGFESNFNMNDIIKNHEAFMNNVIENTRKALSRTMKELVILAKSKGNYTDRTNKLRSSIGYVMYHNGEMIDSYFEASGKGSEGDGKDGIEKGLEFAKSVAEDIDVNGFVCVFVAGERYARYVENKGFDVIAGASLHFDEFLQKNFDIASQDIQDKHGVSINYNKK